MTIRKENALTLMKEIVEKRNWHNGTMTTGGASNIKRKLKTGNVSYEAAVKYLTSFGWTILENETWVKK